MSFEVSWRKVRGELPGWCAGDAGMVPLSARETAKGEEQATQLATLRQVLPVLQRSHLRAKRKPDPRIMHTSPEAHRVPFAKTPQKTFSLIPPKKEAQP